MNLLKHVHVHAGYENNLLSLANKSQLNGSEKGSASSSEKGGDKITTRMVLFLTINNNKTMNETSILQYCYFYKGEEICPKQYDGKNEGKLWQAEKFICEELFGLVDNSTPRISTAQLVSDYVQKWSPYKFRDVMETYFENFPESRSQLI